jgi:hypothetical protein
MHLAPREPTASYRVLKRGLDLTYIFYQGEVKNGYHKRRQKLLEFNGIYLTRKHNIHYLLS